MRCIPGISGLDCEEALDTIPAGKKITLAPVIHGVVALGNTIIPPVIWFWKFKYNSPSTAFNNYSSTYWGLISILTYMNWFIFWVIHPAVFLVPALVFPFVFFKFEKLNKAFVEMFNFAWFAIAALYPFVLGIFIFASSPYWVHTDLKRAQEGFGRRDEDVIVYLYFAMVFLSSMVQIGYNRQLNEWYYGKNEIECDYYIDGYCKQVEREEEPATSGAESFNYDYFEF